MKKKYILVGLVLIIFGFLFFFNDSDIQELKCYEEYSEDGTYRSRAFIVNSPPWFVSSFEQMVIEEVKKINRDITLKSETIYFVKEIDVNLINRFLWGNNDCYSECKGELRSEDYLARVFFFKTSDNRDTVSIKIYTGPTRYY